MDKDKLIDELKQERDHWKKNHDNQVRLKRLLSNRPDLKDKAELIEEIDKLTNKIESLNKAIESFKAYPHYLDNYNINYNINKHDS